MDHNQKSIAVLGAGISGLSTAYALKQREFNVSVYEQNKKPGGVIRTRKENGWLVEAGPNTIMAGHKKLWDFFDKLHLTGRVVKAGDQAKKRYIVRNQKLHPVPTSLPGFLTTSLFSAGAKFRLIKEPFVGISDKKDESIASFISRRLGQEILNYAVNPFVAGVYAGDPASLSIKHTFSSLHNMEQNHGSIFKSFIKKKSSSTKKALLSFDEGLQVLIDRLQHELGKALKLNHAVEQITKGETGWAVKAKAGTTSTTAKHSHVVSTLPADQLSKIWGEPTSKEALRKLENISYAPVSVLALGFKQQQIAHSLDGFGFLVPEKEDLNLLGTLFSSSLFPGRAPADHALLTCFIGGERNPEIAAQSREKLIAKALHDLDNLLGVQGDPVFTRHTCWQQGIPQFNVGYDQYLKAAADFEEGNPGFFIKGNFIHGVSVPDCIRSSLKFAERLSKTANTGK